jgi:hypothetical protein
MVLNVVQRLLIECIYLHHLWATYKLPMGFIIHELLSLKFDFYLYKTDTYKNSIYE